MTENLLGRLFPSEESIVLERIPAEFRAMLWSSKSEDLPKTILEVDKRLRELGLPAMDRQEMEDAGEGNFVVNFSRERENR